VLNALQLHRGGHLLPFTFYLLLFAFQGALDDMGDEHEQRQTLNALITAIDEEPLSPCWRFGASGNKTRVFYLLPFAFQAVASVRNPKSKIENPKSCVGPSAIRTGSRTRPSDWGSNARLGPVEDRRNNRRLATFTCTPCVLQIWWLSPFSSSRKPETGTEPAKPR